MPEALEVAVEALVVPFSALRAPEARASAHKHRASVCLIANAAPPWSASAGRAGKADFLAVCVSFGTAFAFAFGGAPGGRSKLLGNPNRKLASSCFTSILGATVDFPGPDHTPSLSGFAIGFRSSHRRHPLIRAGSACGASYYVSVLSSGLLGEHLCSAMVVEGEPSVITF